MKPLKWIAGALVALALCVALAGNILATELPEVVAIDSLSNLYEGVEFDHDMHLDIADDCTVCHHHAAGVPTSNEICARCHDATDVLANEACDNCHEADPFSAEAIIAREADLNLYHVDKPGLKAAFHLNCLQCHAETGGPTECEGCHVKTETGEAFYHSGRYAPVKGAGAGH